MSLELHDADMQGLSRTDLIAVYYHRGYTIREIVGVMALQHEAVLSERSVNRILQQSRLTRRQNQSNLEDIVQAIQLELSGSGQNAGYRQMRLRLLLHHNIVATCEVVRLALGVIDPHGVMLRQSRRLQRRIYTNKGPNVAIHLDGWDKLKPYGLSVHGAIDGFSRRVLWLKCCDSNKKPQYIASFYIDYIKEIRGIPVRVFGDRGTENAIVRDVQLALRWNHNDQYQGQSSFVYVSSNRNIRIERFWRNLREMCGSVWLGHFKDMCDFGILDTSDNVHLECIRYCFLSLISKDMDEVCTLWNTHHVRRSNHTECPAGKPEVLFFQPEVFGGRDFKFPLDVENGLEDVERVFSQRPPDCGVSQEFLTVANAVVRQLNLRYPARSREEATVLFVRITVFIDQLT